MAGRPRKPTALKVLHGDFETNPERQNKREPTPKKKRPTCPRYLSKQARKAWKDLAAILEGMTVLTEAEGPALELYAVTYDRWRIDADDVREHGTYQVTYDKEGNTIRRRNPAAQSMAENARQLQKLLSEFGLTPSSRSRIQIEEETNDAKSLERRYLT